MIERGYQITLNERVVDAVSSKRKVLMQLPTGGGKTVCFAKLTERFIRNTEKAVLILVHREELMKQAAKTINNMLAFKPSMITSKTSKFAISKVYIGMVESVIGRLDLFTNVGLVIIDECHIANFNKIHSIFLNELIIGVTATPISSSKKEPLNKYYNCIVAGPQISQLIAEGHLAKEIMRCPEDIVDATKFEIDKLKGDYNERQMAIEYKLPKFVMNVIRNYHKFCLGKKTIIFNVNIEHSKEVAEHFAAVGYNCRHIDSDSTKRPSARQGFASEREEILDWFKTTPDAILCNVMIATVGFDEPTVRNVILNFATLSITKFIQACGRGSRFIDQKWLIDKQIEYPYQETEKHYFNIIDMGANYVRFGEWSQDRDWEYIFENPEHAGNGIAPVKTCPECEGLVHAATRVCTLVDTKGNLCLHEFHKKPTALEQDLEEMILVTKGIDVDDLILKNGKKYPYYTFLELGDEVVKNMFKEHGRNCSQTVLQRSFNGYYDLCKDWYNKTLAGKDGYIDSIDDSGWHIRRALNNFNQLIEKYNQKYELEVEQFHNKKVCTDEETTRFKESVFNHSAFVAQPISFEENIEIRVGQTVEHKNLGYGVVEDILDTFTLPVAKIRFKEETKKVIVKYAKMRIVEQVN